ncbi:hypothetical protein L1D16_20415 [Vibrio sp. Isolate31]|nr:hypothetical protein [Vibrio sp. Isolate31]
MKKHVKALNGVVGRWGGEEFIVFFPKSVTYHATALSTAESQARIVGARIYEEFRNHQFFGFNRKNSKQTSVLVLPTAVSFVLLASSTRSSE